MYDSWMEKQYTPYQKGVIKRYYEHKEDLAYQALSEIVSEIYLETNRNKLGKLWKKVETALINAGTDKKKIAELMSSKDVKMLASFVVESF